MIIRVFRAIVPAEMHQEFEDKFKEVSVPLVKGYKGLVALEIAKPTKWNPNEFIMISRWKTEQDLENFAGISWNQAHIPRGMEKYINECSVSHYYNIEIGS